MTVSCYRDLQVWQKARTLVKEVYQASKQFPKEELFALTNQIRRAAVSVPSNIAEGHARNSTKDFLRYLAIAIGSLAELETQLILAGDLDYLSTELLSRLLQAADEIGKMVSGLQKSLHRKL
jgi:four helix bundle protein